MKVLDQKPREKYKSQLWQAEYNDIDYYLMKPQTFMNLSGEALSELCAFHKIPACDVLVIADDTALPFGTLRLRPSGSDGGHNGLKSIAQYLGTDYARLRIGVGGSEQKELSGHVLGSFTAEENENLPQLLDLSARASLSFFENGLQKTMNHFNKAHFAVAP